MYEWNSNDKMYDDEVGWRVIHCISVAQDRDRQHAVVNAAMNLWFQ